jgi:hypothetical protein
MLNFSHACSVWLRYDVKSVRRIGFHTRCKMQLTMCDENSSSKQSSGASIKLVDGLHGQFEQLTQLQMYNHTASLFIC